MATKGMPANKPATTAQHLLGAIDGQPVDETCLRILHAIADGQSPEAFIAGLEESDVPMVTELVREMTASMKSALRELKRRTEAQPGATS